MAPSIRVTRFNELMASNQWPCPLFSHNGIQLQFKWCARGDTSTFSSRPTGHGFIWHARPVTLPFISNEKWRGKWVSSHDSWTPTESSGTGRMKNGRHLRVADKHFRLQRPGVRLTNSTVTRTKCTASISRLCGARSMTNWVQRRRIDVIGTPPAAETKF